MHHSTQVPFATTSFLTCNAVNMSVNIHYKASKKYASARTRIMISISEPNRQTTGTGKSLSEALIFASTNLQHVDRLFIELQVQYMKIPSSNQEGTCCVQKLFLTFRTILAHNMFSQCSAKRRASDKDLPVPDGERSNSKSNFILG